MAKVYKVYMGVGHGGSDPGAVFGIHREAVYALDIATACTNELCRHGVSVLQSRIVDEYESAAAKVKECNTYAPDVALDIHLNSSVKHNADGFEIYHTVGGGKGKELAQSIEAAVKAIGQNSRGVKYKTNGSGKDYFGIIRQTNCPATLVECAFIDSADVQIVDTNKERDVMGEAIAHGILTYLGIPIKPVQTVQQTVQQATQQTTQNKKTDSSSEYIKKYQKWLNSNYSAGLSADGIYGKLTRTASVKALQKIFGVSADGIFGSKTRAASRTASIGTRGALAYIVQGLMYCKGFDPQGFDGVFGQNTAAAVKKYQKSCGLESDGIVGKATWTELVK